MQFFTLAATVLRGGYLLIFTGCRNVLDW